MSNRDLTIKTKPLSMMMHQNQKEAVSKINLENLLLSPQDAKL